MNNQPDAGKASALKIGEKLREAREKKALTIDQVQKQTRIHSTVISALEEGRADGILAPNYVKSFLKNYAAFLGLDSKELLGSYVSSHPELGEVSSRLSKLEARSPARTNDALRILRRLFITVLILIATFFLVKMIISVFKPSKKTVKPAAASTASGTANKRRSPSKRDNVFKEIPRSTPISLIIKVNRPVMVQVKRDGVLLFKRVLKKGSVESLTAKNNINIFVAKAESIELTLNGKNLGSPGKGTISDLEITRSGLRIK